MNVSLSLAAALPIVLSKRYLITSSIHSAHVIARLSSQVSTCLGQVTGLSWSGNSSSKTQNY